MHSGNVRRRSRYGFTLLELLVVVAIAVVLLGLLLIAIQKARAVAARAACQNNLHEIGLALHAYHIANKTFPAGGWIPSASQTNTQTKNIGWSAEILPWLEQQGIFDTINFNRPYNDPVNAAAGHNVLKAFLCPAVPRKTFWKRDTGDKSDFAEAHYGGMYGPRGLASPAQRNSPPRGAMIFNQAFALSDITNGPGQTILIGEAPDSIHGIWISGHNIFDQSAAINAHPQFEYGTELESYHAGGAHALFADGAVRFLPEKLDCKVLSAMCVRDADPR